jgi:hypothetical protein
MAKYKVTGTIEYNFSVIVDVDNVDEAVERAIDLADDGDIDFGPPTGLANIDSVAPRMDE